MKLMNRSIAGRDGSGTIRPCGLIRGDLVVLSVLLVLALLAAWFGPRVGGGIPRGDSFAFFIPMFSFMGERLGAGDIPGWNPYTLSGVPFAGDPESGWLYFPAFHERTDPELPLLQGDLRWVGFSPLRPARCPLHHRGCPDPGRP